MGSVFDLHVHTNRGSRDSSFEPEEMVSEAQRLGLTGVLVTEHEGWVRHDFEKFVQRHDLIQDLVVVRAIEVYTLVGHVITLGVDGYPQGASNLRELRKEIDRVGGYMILAHPFRFLFDPAGIYTRNLLFEDPKKLPKSPEEAAQHPAFQLIDEVEVVNGGNLEPENRFAQELVRVLGLRGTGGSDAHSAQGFGKGVTLFPGDIRNERDLLDALRARAFSPVEGFHVGQVSHYGTPVPAAAALVNGA